MEGSDGVGKPRVGCANEAHMENVILHDVTESLKKRMVNDRSLVIKDAYGPMNWVHDNVSIEGFHRSLRHRHERIVRVHCLLHQFKLAIIIV